MSALECNSQFVEQFKKGDALSFFEKDMNKQFPGFSAMNFDRVTLFTKPSGEYFVSFSNAINFVPLNAAYYYSAAYIFKFVKEDGTNRIRIIQSIQSPLSSGENQKATDFRIPTRSDVEKTKCVMKAAKILSVSEGDECLIFERSEYFDVILKNESVEGFWWINKNNFSVIREGHNSLVPPPTEKSDWVKIDWK